MSNYIRLHKRADAKARYIARLIEVDGMKQKKVALILGLSSSRISEIYRKHLRKIDNPRYKYGHSVYLKTDVFSDFKKHYDEVMEKGE